ncbi:PAS domain S-box-containing protein [Oceanospirillum linum]|nr:PAS domain S-box-containing protein [Oleiphilus messinensis]SMP25341.1 PAS domain S-box-containing protein [Oceanospirillum linum]
MLLMDNRTQWISVIMAGLILLTCFLGFYQLQKDQYASRKDQLEEKLYSSERIFSHWFQQQKNRVNAWSRHQVVLESADLLSEIGTSRSELLAGPVSAKLRQIFSPLITSSKIDSYLLIDSRGLVLAASDDRLTGLPSPIGEHLSFLTPLWQGNNQWLLPYVNPSMSLDQSGVFRQEQPMLLIAAPVKHELKVKMALIFTVNMRRELHHLMQDTLVTPDFFLQVTARNRSLVDIGQKQFDDNASESEPLLVRKDHDLLPVSFTVGKVFPVYPVFSTQQNLLLGIGSLALLVVVFLLVRLLREAPVADKPDSLSQIFYERGREGLLQLSDTGVVTSFNRQSALLLAGAQEVTPESMSILLAECALGLNDESGHPMGDLKMLLTREAGARYYTWWSANGARRLLEVSRECLSSGAEPVISIRDVTQSRQEYLRLKRQSEALDDAAELVLWVGREGGIVSANQTAVALLGYSQKEFQGLSVGDIDSSLNEESWRLIWARIRRGESIEQESNVLRRNGIPFPVELLVRYYSDGFEEYACLSFRDISKRKRLEVDLYRKRMRLTEKLSVTSQELEVREAENEALIEALPDLLVVFNSRFEVLSYQQPQGEILPLKLNAGVLLCQLFPPLDAKVLQHHLTDQAYSGLARYFTEITLENQWQVQTLELRFARTGTNKILLLVRDITERKRAEYFRQFNNRLLMSISQMQTHFICNSNKLPDIPGQLYSLVNLVQSEAGFYWLAESLQQKLGCPASGHRFRRPEAFLNHEDDISLIYERIAQVVAHWRASIETPEPVLTPLQDIFANSARDIRNEGLLLLPVLSGDYPVICFSLVLDDYRHWMSELRLFDPWLATVAALLSAYESETERQWAERNVQLEKERAEHASQAKTQFLSRMSHEFRTPLNAILGFGHLLQLEEGLDDEHLEHLAQIVNSGQAMLDLVDDVLDLAQLERQEFSVDITRVCLNQVATDCVSDVIDEIERADLRFEADLPGQDYFVRADERRLRQVITSLLKNAICYTDSGGLIRLSHQCCGQYCELSIQDTGKGISQDFIDKIFMPFEAAEGYINAQGMGNGLALARYALEAMGGTIRVDSEVGVGSIFTLRVPCDASEDHCAQVDQQDNPPRLLTDASVTGRFLPASEPETCTPGKAFRVLYVEDDEANRKVLERLILHFDPDIEFVGQETAEEGVAAFLQERPDLVFVDMNLGPVSGVKVLNMIRSHSEGSELPVIAVSGDVASETIENALDQGFDDYLCKPISIETLSSVIIRYRSG